MTFEDFIDSEELPQLVGSNAESYRARWRKMYAKAGSIAKMNSTRSWNWAGFLLSGPWLFYRKMYLEGCIWAVAVILLTVAENVTGSPLNGTTLGLCIGIGMYGDSWYFKHTYKRISALRGGDQFASKSGGVSWTAALTSSLMVALIVVALSIPESGWIAFRKGYDEAKEEPATPPVAKTQEAPVATAFEPAGDYEYREKGSSGGLGLIRQADGTYEISIGTVNSRTLHDCSIGEQADSRVLARAEPITGKTGIAFHWTDNEEPSCSVEIEVVPGSANVSISDSNCSRYCGASGDFTGVYVAKTK